MALVISVAQQKGGAGKTSVTAHLAALWSNPPHTDGQASQPQTVIALDADPQASLRNWHQLRCDRGFEPGTLTVKQADGWRFTSEVTRAKREADIVLIDMPPRADAASSGAFRAADLVLVPMPLSPMDLWATGPTIEMARQFNTPLLVVLNRVPPRTRLNDAIAEAVKAEGWPLARTMLGNRVAFAVSLMQGRGITETEPNSAGAAELRLLSGEVLAVARGLAAAA